jgi:hypothetical protein
MTGKDQAALWQQIVQDYETIRAEQEAVWQALDLSETAPVMEQLFLLLEEIEHAAILTASPLPALNWAAPEK